MNDWKALTGLELRSLYGINRFLHTRDKKAKRNYLLLAGVWVFLVLMVWGYVAGLVVGLCALGLGDLVPAYLVILASLLIFVFGLFTAGHRVFGQRGYDLLSAMPIRPGAIVTSRFFCMYTEYLVLALLIMVPGIATYGILQQPELLFYAVALLGTLLLPAIPLVAVTLLGTVILAISSRMRHKHLIQTALMLLLVVGILLGSFGMEQFAEEITPEMLASLAQSLGATFEKLYLPAMWLQSAMLDNDLWGLLLFAGLSLGLVGLCMAAAARLFGPVMAGLFRVTARHDYKISHMESRSILKALLLREAKRYFFSSIYVTNTIIGPIMGTILAGALCFMGLDTITATIPMDVTALVPLVFAAAFCMMTTTSVSVSMEGRQFWIIQSLPVPAKTLLDSKLLLNLLLMAPFYVLSEVFLIIAMKPGFWELLWLLALPALVMVFSAVFGITVNLKFHRFDWEKEEQIVKQSASAALGGFGAILLALPLGAVLMTVPAAFVGYAQLGICLILAGVTLLLYSSNNRTRLEML